MQRKSDGFTFVEMLVVVTIIGILATLALPRLGAMRSRSQLAAVKSDVRNIESAEEAYFADHGVYGTDTDLSIANAYNISNGNSITVTATDNGYTVHATNSSISNGTSSCSVEAGTDATTPALDGKMTCP